MFAPARSPKAILQNVKLVATRDQVLAMGTDMEVGVRVVVEGVEVETPGAAVLPVSNFGAILRESTDAKLILEATQNGVIVKGARSEYKLPAGDPEEFPNVVEFAEEKYHAISARLFREMIMRTEFSTDTESSRYALGGVLFEFEPTQITAVGTDGRRLARMLGTAEAVGGHRGGEGNTIVRTQSMKLLQRAIADSDEYVHLAARSNDLLIRTPRALFYSRLVEGRFPRWRDVFPSRSDSTQLDVTVGPFFAAVRQAAIACDNDSRGIDCTFGDGNLVLAATTAQHGQSRVEMPISYGGAPITVRLDHRFLTDFLRVLNTEAVVTIDIENSESAAVFYTDDKRYGYVVMPLARDSA
jgi:DNA polymerase-3 subunit beta